MNIKKGKKIAASVLSAGLIASTLSGANLGLPLMAAQAAAEKTAAEQAAPEYRFFEVNGGWHYAESIPLYNEVMEKLYLTSAEDTTGATGTTETTGTTTGAAGALSQTAPEAERQSVQTGEEAVSFQSPELYFFYNNEIVGYPSADLNLSAAADTEITVELEAVTKDGQGHVIGTGTTQVSKGDQSVKVDLKRAEKNGEDDYDFVAYQFPVKEGGTLKVNVRGEKGSDLSITTGGEKASTVSVPFIETDENAYNGKILKGADTFTGTLYWLEHGIYLNYTKKDQNDTWEKYPADAAYQVDAEGKADFGDFQFIPEGNAIKNAAEQSYTGEDKASQPFPTIRHRLLDRVPVKPVSDTLYLPSVKTLKYDVFMPTGNSGSDKPPVILYIHGYNGSYSALPPFLTQMLKEGYAVAGIDLRNYPSNTSPDYYQDIKGNIRELRARADEYGFDGDRMGIFGQSLGGNTALMMLVTGDVEEMEGTVGGNAGVSSRLQAGISGYGWTDMLNFGADQRTDNANNLELLSTMVSGGDGESAPIAQAIDFYGPGKGLLVLRNYLQEREAAERQGKLAAFTAKDYTLVIDDAYVDKWFSVIGESLFTGSSVVVTKGTYTYKHEDLMNKIAEAKAASPITYVSPDDPAVGMFAGYGGAQNITNTQSVRTLQALSDAGVEGFLYANTLGDYGKNSVVQASMKNYFEEYLMNGRSGIKLVIREDSTKAVVNEHSVDSGKTLQKAENTYLFPLEFVNSQTEVPEPKEIPENSVLDVAGSKYVTAKYLQAAGFTVNEYPDQKLAVIQKADAPKKEKSEVKKAEKTSTYGSYSGYSEEEYPNYKVSSLYVEVPASYEGAAKSDPDSKDQTVKLAVDYVLPADASGTVDTTKKYPTVILASRGGRFKEDDLNGNGPIAINLIRHGYAYVAVEMRGCGASFGVCNSFASVENRNDVKYLIENWLNKQDWSDGKSAMMGGSNRGLIQLATAGVAPEGLLGITPVVCNADFYYQDYINGVSACPAGMKLSGTSKDSEAKPYEEWKESTTVQFVDEDPNGEEAYKAYVYQTEKNKPFTGTLLAPNMLRDQEHADMYNEQVNLTIPPVESSEEIAKSGVKLHQLAGYYDSNAEFQVAAANTWGGTAVIGPWNHSGTVRNIVDEAVYPNGKFDIAGDYLRWFDYVLKGVDNGYDQAPPFYYYVAGADKDTEWRYADTMPIDNTQNSVLYLAAEEEQVDVAEALKLKGAQSNNGKLTPETSDAATTDYKVDTSIQMPEDYQGMNLTSTADLSQDVDAKGLTFTSAPLANKTEIVGIPDIDLWVSSSNAEDADFVAYLEVVNEDGTSKYLSRAQQRASHRTTGENALWDSTEGLKGRYHTSLTKDVNAALEEGLEKPVQLQFNFDFVSVALQPGQSIRVTVTCANTAMYQHQMYYDVKDGEYVLKTSDLPEIKLYTGADHASMLSLPVVENKVNTFNGTIALTDGSFTGPATLYTFEKNWYVAYNGTWKKLETGSEAAKYTITGKTANFEAAGFTFAMEGGVVKNGIAQNYEGGQSNDQSIPGVYEVNVDTVPIQTVPDALYLPLKKELNLNLFLPEKSAEEGLSPLLIYIHGYGGTTIGIDNFLTEAISKGYAVAGVDLRNYPSNFSPDYYQDIKGAIRFLRAHASEYGLDPEKFGVYGQSLGGNTALMMALSGDEKDMEGEVGGNLEVSSRVQAAIVGYGWSDAMNFGADQRTDNANNPALLAGMVTGGDGEAAPCAKAINWYGPGKGYLMLRNYEEAKAKAEADGTLEQFMSKDYSFTIDDAYIKTYFPNVEANAFISGSAAAATMGTYTFPHKDIEDAIKRAHDASPLYHVSEDDPVIMLYGGYGGKQNITNTQSIRTFSALQDAGVLAFYQGNTLGNYGKEESVRAGFWEYLASYLPVKSEEAVPAEGDKPAEEKPADGKPADAKPADAKPEKKSYPTDLACPPLGYGILALGAAAWAVGALKGKKEEEKEEKKEEKKEK